MQRVLASLRQGPALRNSTDLEQVSFVARNQFSPRQREPLILVQYTEGGSCPLLQSKTTTRLRTPDYDWGPFFQSLDKVPRSPD